jgi:hypothetical protein
MYSFSKQSVLVAFFIVGIYLAGQAQSSVCPITVLKIGHLDGRVVWKDNKAALFGTTVELFDISDEQALLETVQTNANGEFSFRTARKGKFALKVHLGTTEEAIGPSYWVPITVKKWNARDSRSILISRGFDCWDSEARVDKTNLAIQK